MMYLFNRSVFSLCDVSPFFLSQSMLDWSRRDNQVKTWQLFHLALIDFKVAVCNFYHKGSKFNQRKHAVSLNSVFFLNSDCSKCIYPAHMLTRLRRRHYCHLQAWSAGFGILWHVCKLIGKTSISISACWRNLRFMRFPTYYLSIFFSRLCSGRWRYRVAFSSWSPALRVLRGQGPINRMNWRTDSQRRAAGVLLTTTVRMFSQQSRQMTKKWVADSHGCTSAALWREYLGVSQRVRWLMGSCLPVKLLWEMTSCTERLPRSQPYRSLCTGKAFCVSFVLWSGVEATEPWLVRRWENMFARQCYRKG